METDRLTVSPASFWMPEYLPLSAWQKHGPFAFWLVDALKPQLLVELGTHYGYSYFAFCQAIKRLELDTAAFAVDTWQGDDHAGFYGDDVYSTVSAQNGKYASFSTLMRCDFETASSYFKNGSIDLLHIDGRHEYDDVKNDYVKWQTKLTDDAVVLFHDTNVRERNFGVWKFFQELKELHPSFEFMHGHGLGVVCAKGSIPEGLRILMSADTELVRSTRLAYAALGDMVAERDQTSKLRKGIDALHGEIDLEPAGILALASSLGPDATLTHVGNVHAAQRAAVDALQRDADVRIADAQRQAEASIADIRRQADTRIADIQRHTAAEVSAARTLAEAERNQRSAVDAQRAEDQAVMEAAQARIADYVRAVSLLRMTLRGRDRTIARLRWDAERVHAIAPMSRALDDERRIRDDLEARLASIERSRPWRAIAKARTIAGRAALPGPVSDTVAGTDEDRRLSTAIERTGLFDRSYYLDHNSDVADANLDPALHFAKAGWKEGRNPSASFDTAFYLVQNDDVAASGLNPLLHYADGGAAEGRLPAPRAEQNDDDPEQALSLAREVRETGLFDEDFYVLHNPDIAAEGIDPALHFALDGWREGRNPSADFDTRYYLDSNPDIAALDINPLLHFAQDGIVEGRRPAPGPSRPVDPASDYARWVTAHDTLTNDDRRAIRARLTRLSYRPLISVVMPVYNTDLRFLREAIGSVQAQLYPDWELCIADDASTDPGVVALVREMAAADPRIKLVVRTENGHISASSNSALALATGEFVALMDHDDIIPEHALFVVVAHLNKNRDYDLIYSDEDHIDESGVRFDPHFKTDFNPELLLGQNFVNHLGLYRRSVLESIGGFRLGFEGSQDYDLVLRVVDAIDPKRILHIPSILYHWRSSSAGASFSQSFLDRCIASARTAIQEHLVRTGRDGEVVPHATVPSWHRVIRKRPDPAPLVSIIIPTKDRVEILKPCCDGILQRTDYPNIELIVVDHQSSDPATIAYFDELSRDDRVRVMPYEGAFNYSAINNTAVRQTSGPLLAFLNNDVEVIAGTWLDEMVALAMVPDVGAVGAKLLYPDGRVQHGGVVLGAGGVAGHFFHSLNARDPGYMGRAVLTTAVSAVTGACLLVRREIFDQVGGFDEQNLAVAFNDVDLCLKVREAGFRNVLAAEAVLYHHESISRGADTTPAKAARFIQEINFMVEKWGEHLHCDPFYNINLDLNSANFSPAHQTRNNSAWSIHK